MKNQEWFLTVMVVVLVTLLVLSTLHDPEDVHV